MSDFGIICEWNPFHGGHEYLVREARAMGAERIVGIMSGNSTQRGELAVADQYLRAEAAVRCGVDLVLSLPFPWCSGSAESFAGAGVHIAEHFADTLIFGSECGDLSLLRRGAQAASDPLFRENYRKALSAGQGAAAAYFENLNRICTCELSSNDLLGIEYLRAAFEQESHLRFVTVTRRGSAYRESSLETDGYPSASALRALWEQGQEAEAYLPDAAREVYLRGKKEGRLVDFGEAARAMLSFFRMHDGSDFEGMVGADGGLGNRICHVAREATDGESFLELLRTKRYTDAHIRRTLLFCMTGVTQADLKATVRYTTVLAANERGRELLAQKRKEQGTLLAVTKPSDAPADARQSVLGARLDRFFTLALTKPKPAGELLTKRPYLD